MRYCVVSALQENIKPSDLECGAAGLAREQEELQPAAKAGQTMAASPPRILAIASLILFAAAFVITDRAMDWPDVFLVAGGAAGLLAACIALRPAAKSPPEKSAPRTGAEGIESRLEQLKDAQWVLSENEARYRDLLDTQDDMISRRDARGRYVFVNKTFCSALGVAPSDVIGKKFTPKILDGQVHAALATERDQRRTYEELIQTRRGPRWISWEERLVPATSGTGFELQSIGRDVTDEREAEALLTEARDQAQSANRAKSRFLAAMSHEIRTPMNGILGMTSLLADTPQTAEQHTYLTAIDKSARALLALIDEILDFSKIEAGKMELIIAPFGLRSSVLSAIDLLAPRARTKGLDLTWKFAPDLPETVIGDELRVRQIVLNLLSNAVKFTDIGGVRIAVMPLSNENIDGTLTVSISVADTGIGLAAGDMQKLFDEFEQAEAVISRREGGTGLGLAISKRLARAMGGDIAAEGAPGRGATFTAVLRFGRVPDATEFAARDTRPPAQIDSFAPIQNKVPSAASRLQPRVLIAEDNEINALLARRVVEKSDCRAFVVGTGAEAVAAVKEMLQAAGEPIDLILMDVFMPGLDGMAAAREIGRLFREAHDLPSGGRNRSLKRPPIIALTANAFAEDRQRCLAAGMDDYLAKPFDAADLQGLLARWVTTGRAS